MNQRGLFSVKRVLLILTVVVIGIIAAVAHGIYHLTAVTIPHSYAAWTTGDLLIEYMDTHDGKWPRGWEELREARDSLVHKDRNIYFDFEKLPAIVKVDWNADPEALAKAFPDVKVVMQLDGTKLEAKWGADTEPNAKVGRYLSEKYSGSQKARK